nr:ribonuclease H-like domain-containing protein [Tanacetum cinerariifolium]
AVKGNGDTAVKDSEGCKWRNKRKFCNKVFNYNSGSKFRKSVNDPLGKLIALKDKGIVDSRCSRHMIGNKAHLTDYQEFKGGSIAFGGSNGRITGKGKIKAGSKELVSPKQMALGKDNSNPLIVDSLLKTIWLSLHHVIAMKHWLFQSKRLLRVVFTEDVIRHDLRLDDVDGVECLPNEEIFTKLALPNALTPPSPTTEPSPPLQEAITTPLQAQPIPPPSPPQEQPTTTFESSMSILNTLMKTYATLSQKVTHLEQDKIAQALEIIKLKKSFKKLEKKRRSKSSRDYSVDMKSQAHLGAELQGRKDDDNAAIKDASVAEPTVFDDEEVTMTMAQTQIKIKAKKERLLDEQMAKRLHDEEVEQAAARKKQEKDDLQKAKVLQQSMLTSKKTLTGMLLLSKCMNYDKVRPIFEREYSKVQTLFKPDKDVEEPQKKRVAEETLLQESFKKLKAVEVSGSHSTQDTPTDDHKEMSEEYVKNMLEIVPVSKFKVEALQIKYPLIDLEIHSEGSRSYWKIIRVGEIT